ncbi:MAG: preprotein translocase subunit Sec61beta [Candidatus Pacearchaeota archaeon]
MAEEGKISMPSGMGGLMRYFDEYKSKIQIKPTYVIAFVIILIILVTLIFPVLFPLKT